MFVTVTWRRSFLGHEASREYEAGANRINLPSFRHINQLLIINILIIMYNYNINYNKLYTIYN